MKNETAMPIDIQPAGDCQFKESEVTAATSKHAGPLDIRILLYFVPHISSEEHRQEILESDTAGNDVSAYYDREKRRWAGRGTRIVLPIPLAV